MPISLDQPFWIGDRHFSETDIALLWTTILQFPNLSRAELVATLCENLPWKSLQGKPRREACHQLLDALEGTPGFRIPPKRQGGTFPRPEHRGTPMPNLMLDASLAAIRPVVIVPVRPADRLPWNATMATPERPAIWAACSSPARPKLCRRGIPGLVGMRRLGRGRQDRYKTMHLPRKTIWLYPLVRHWRTALTAPWPPWTETEETDHA